MSHKNFIQVIFSLVLLASIAEAKSNKFKSDDCLFFPVDAKAGTAAGQAIWKIIGVEKDGRYVVRVFGGKGVELKPDAFTANGWGKNTETLSKENTDKDGMKVDCPKE